MKYRTMPGSDEELSILGYGCMRLPTKVGGSASRLIDKDKALKQIRGAIDRGVNYIDTAYPYHLGASETFLGEYVLKDGYRDKVKLATKLPCISIRKKESIRETFTKQLKKLQTDYFDYYLLHSLDGQTWDRMLDLGIIQFMNEIKASGQVKKMGFSFHGKKEDFMRICDGYDFDFAQVQFNILDESFQAGIEGIEYAHQKGMGIIAMEPLRGGSLVGKIPLEVQKVYDESPIKRSPAEWALRWVWNHPAVTVVLSGMNVDEHIDENIKIASDALPGGLSDEDLSVISDVRDAYNKLLQVGCTGCAYCMPCPAGIDIPAAFKNLNNYYMFSKTRAKIFHAVYLGVQTEDGKAHFTDVCIDCGQCEDKCPQHIEVRQVFKQVQTDLEGPLIKGIATLGRVVLNRNQTIRK
ncbi:MAG: aldo/keto reductase [Clostridiales bacterium]|nr:aldo/keto reductase [Clostridiales bacterium]